MKGRRGRGGTTRDGDDRRVKEVGEKRDEGEKKRQDRTPEKEGMVIV